MAKKNKPPEVNVDLLEIDMTTGAHWLSPAQKFQDSPKFKEIRERPRAKYLAERKAKRETAKRKR